MFCHGLYWNKVLLFFSFSFFCYEIASRLDWTITCTLFLKLTFENHVRSLLIDQIRKSTTLFFWNLTHEYSAKFKKVEFFIGRTCHAMPMPPSEALPNQQQCVVRLVRQISLCSCSPLIFEFFSSFTYQIREKKLQTKRGWSQPYDAPPWSTILSTRWCLPVHCLPGSLIRSVCFPFCLAHSFSLLSCANITLRFFAKNFLYFFSLFFWFS